MSCQRHRPPNSQPSPDGGYREIGRLMRYPDHHKAVILPDLINAIRDGHPFGLARIIVFQNIQRFAPPRAARVSKVPTSSRFLVSTLITGFPAFKKALRHRTTYRICWSRSGACCFVNRLRLTCKL